MENDLFWFDPADYTYEEQHLYVALAWHAFGAALGCLADEAQDYLTIERLRALGA